MPRIWIGVLKSHWISIGIVGRSTLHHAADAMKWLLRIPFVGELAANDGRMHDPLQHLAHVRRLPVSEENNFRFDRELCVRIPNAQISPVAGFYAALLAGNVTQARRLSAH